MYRREGRRGGKSRAQPRADSVGLRVWALGNDLAHLPPLPTQGAALCGGQAGPCLLYTSDAADDLMIV